MQNDNRDWKILVVDDDDDVQMITAMVLEEFEFLGRRAHILPAKSAREAMELVTEHPDIAVALVDVVMESKDAGLLLVDYIRNIAGNRRVRIILRTGQPGAAPERDVVVRYDINDYKDKTELTVLRLQTAVHTALRSYNDIMTIERNRAGLEKIIHASSDLFRYKNLERFAEGVLEQLVSILNLERSYMACFVSSHTEERQNSGWYTLLAAIGKYQDRIGQRLEDMTDIDDPDLLSDIRAAIARQSGYREGSRIVLFIRSATGAAGIVRLCGIRPLSGMDEQLLTVFANNISTAFDNLCLRTDVEDTQRELIVCLGEAIDMRSLETGTHVVHVAKLSRLIATTLGLPKRDVEILGIIAPMHDVGKITIPDKILNKPGRLTTGEFEIMKTHSYNGYKLLSKSQRELMQDAAIVALQHHEKHDGTGYPNGLRGEGIHIFARIVGLVDVLDALVSDRVYKKAWQLSEAIGYIREQSGFQFDPRVVAALMANLKEVEEMYKAESQPRLY